MSDTRARGHPPATRVDIDMRARGYPGATRHDAITRARDHLGTTRRSDRAALLILVPLIFSCVSPAHAQTAATLDAALNHKEDAVLEFKLALEAARIGISNGTLSNATCDVYSACSAELASPFCHFNYGNSAGCGCETGRTVDSSNSVVKSSPQLGASPYSVKRTACEAKHVDATLRNLYGSMIEEGDAKWLFYGSNDGVLINFPGIVWDEDVADNACGASYDARIRPWHMAGATGPKNLVLILDTSGSMQLQNRLSLLKNAAKAVLDATTFADFVGVVQFDSDADTFAGLTTLARAMPGFKDELAQYVDGFRPSGGTNMIAGMERAFKLVDDSRGKSYEAGCHTTYVLVTDGEWAADPQATITARQASSAGADEHFFVVGLGSGVSEQALRGLSCATGAIYTHAADGDESALRRAMISFYKYFALFKSIQKVEGFSWSEPYVSIPSIWGKMTTAVAPVYDKSREPWHMMGVAGVDATICDLLADEVPEPESAARATQRGCVCQDSWSYGGATFTGCADVDWPVPWCATQGSCGSCDTPSVSGGCWDDCEPEGKEGVLQDTLLSRATSWCEPASLDACALEALRLSVGEPECAASEPGLDYASCTETQIEAYAWAIDGPRDPGETEYALRAVKSSLVGTPYDMNADACVCDDNMQPSCACAAAATAAEEASAREDENEDEEPDITVTGIVSIVVPIAVLCACAALRFARRSTTKDTSAGVTTQAPQPMYVYPTQPMPPGQPQPMQPTMQPYAGPYGAQPPPQQNAYPQYYPRNA